MADTLHNLISYALMLAVHALSSGATLALSIQDAGGQILVADFDAVEAVSSHGVSPSVDALIIGHWRGL